MKKFLVLLLALVMVLSVFAACAQTDKDSDKDSEKTEASETKKPATSSPAADNDDPDEIERRFLAFLEEAKREGVSREDFERCRRALYADVIRNYDSTEDIATELLTFVFDGGELFDYPSVIESLTWEEINTLLLELPDRSALCLSAVYPMEGQEKGEEHHV